MEQTNDLELSVSLCKDGCTYACIHGALRTYLAGQYAGNQSPPGSKANKPKPVHPEKLKRDILHLCREDSNLIDGFLRGNCAHAVGHGFRAMAPNIAEARLRCATFPDVERRYYCESGVFMESRWKMRDELYGAGVSSADWDEAAIDYCVQKTDLPSACLRFLLEEPLDPQETRFLERKCLKMDVKTRRGCFNAIGFSNRQYVASHPEEVNRICRIGDPVDRKLCISGVFFIKPDNPLKEELLAACPYLQNQELRATCDDQNGRIYYQVGNPIMNLMLTDE